MLQSIAALGRHLKPGLIVLAGTLISYWVLRAAMTERALLPAITYAVGILLSLVMLAKGIGAWCQQVGRAVDSPAARARFVDYLDRISTERPPVASEELGKLAIEMKGQELPASFDGCWAFNLPAKDFPVYEVAAYLLLSEEQLCVGIVAGVRGEWVETRHLYAQVEREGSSLTSIGSYGSLEWLPAGSPVVIAYSGGNTAELSWRLGSHRMHRAPVPESLKRFIPNLPSN